MSRTSRSALTCSLLRGARLVWIAATIASLPAAAETLRYEMPIGDHEQAEFVIPFDVVHAGRVDAEISWTGARILSLRLSGPGDSVHVARSGPSPQRVQASATEDTLAAGREWKISVRALPARGAALATLVVTTPEPAAPSEEEPAPPAPVVSVPVATPDPWMVPRAAPAGASPRRTRLFASIEAFRASVVIASGDPRPDACSWQTEFLRYAAGLRDGPPGAGTPTDSAPACGARFAAALARIEWLRSTDDPEVRSAPPDDPDARLEWRARRDDKIRPMEQELDSLFGMLRAGSCPDLAGEVWPSRMLACATSCERHFEERSRLGDEAVRYAEIAADEWPVLSAAAAVLDAIASKDEAPETAHVP